MKRVLRVFPILGWLLLGALIGGTWWYYGYPELFPVLPDAFWRWLDWLCGAENVDQQDDVGASFFVACAFVILSVLAWLTALAWRHFGCQGERTKLILRFFYTLGWLLFGATIVGAWWHASPKLLPIPDAFWHWLGDLFGADNANKQQKVEFLFVIACAFVVEAGLTWLAWRRFRRKG